MADNKTLEKVEKEVGLEIYKAAAKVLEPLEQGKLEDRGHNIAEAISVWGRKIVRSQWTDKKEAAVAEKRAQEELGD